MLGMPLTSEDVEDEQHFLFDCPAYMTSEQSMLVFFNRPFPFHETSHN